MARGRINIPLDYMPPAEARQEVVEPTLPARKLPEVGLQSLEGAASVVKPIAEMFPGSGFVTGVQKRGSEGGADVLAELLGIAGGLTGSVGGLPGAAAGYTIGKSGYKGLRKLLNNQDDIIPVMPVNQANLKEKGLDFKAGGEYINPKTKDILTGKNVGAANIKIVPEMGIKGGRPMASFNVSKLDVSEVGTLGKGNTDILVNLVKPTKKGNKAGWKWINIKDKNLESINTLVSVVHKGKHYFTLESDFSKGANLKTYPKSKTEPRLRPTAKGTIDLQDQVGTIKLRNKEHPVYRKIIAKYTGGQIKKGGSIAERNPYNYEPRAI
tara:strand:- start:508 stop:1482 length:975 start_codon:yes stop_codon:yes gene_type:complete